MAVWIVFIASLAGSGRTSDDAAFNEVVETSAVGDQLPKPAQLVGKPLTVCDVLSPDPTRFNGKWIALRGYLEGTDEGVWLAGECATHLVTKGLTWGNYISIWVVESDRSATRSWERLQKRLQRLHADGTKTRVWVTLGGRLETRATMDDAVVQMPYGLMRAGFGHMGASPAELDVVSVRDISVEQSPERSR